MRGSRLVDGDGRTGVEGVQQGVVVLNCQSWRTDAGINWMVNEKEVVVVAATWGRRRRRRQR